MASDSVGASSEGALTGTLRLIADKDSIFPNPLDDIQTEIIIVGGMSWRIYIDVGKEINLQQVFNDYSVRSVDIKCDYKLINHRRDADSITRTSNWTFSLMDNAHTFGYLFYYPHTNREIILDEERGFLKDNKFTLQMTISLSNIIGFRKFRRINLNDPNEPTSNIILDVEGEKIRVCKELLSIHSPFFARLFYGESVDKTQKEFKLDDNIDHREFMDLLNAIYPSFKDTTDCVTVRGRNIRAMLRLGDRFDIAVVLDGCEQFLIHRGSLPDVHIPWAEKLMFAYRYRLEKLQAHCLDSWPRHLQRANFVDARSYHRTYITNPNEPTHDFVLIIEGKKVNVSKKILSIYSPVLNTMFMNEPTEKNELELKDVGHKEFMEMLEFIYNPATARETITKENCRNLFKLAERFDIEMITHECEQFLLDSGRSSHSTVEKLAIADRYRLWQLQKHCLDSLTGPQLVHNLRKSPGYEDLSDATIRQLFEKMIEFCDEEE